MSEIVLHLPACPSVNRTRRIDWRGNKKLVAWRKTADAEIRAAGSHRQWISYGMCSPMQCFEVNIAVPDDNGSDLDNLKAIADYLKHIKVIADDSRRHMRRFTVEVDKRVPQGCCRVTLRPWQEGTR